MSKLKFTIREVMLVTLAVGLSFGWWVDRSALKREIFKLRISASKFEDRRDSVEQIMASTVDPEFVSYLIYALSDPEERIASAAANRLSKISGIDGGFGPVSQTTPKAKLAVMRNWIEWYLTVEGG